jgi:hypothetical protein
LEKTLSNQTGNVSANFTLMRVLPTIVAVETKQVLCIVSVCVAIVIRQAKCILYIVIGGLPRSTLFFHIVSQMARFSKKKTLMNTKCAFRLHLQRLSETFFILRRTERGFIKKSSCLHEKYPLFLSDFNVTWFFSTVFLKIILKCHENSSSGNQVVPCGKTDGWTDGQK